MTLAADYDGQKNKNKNLITWFLKSKKKKNKKADSQEYERKLPAIYFDFDALQTEQLKNFLDEIIETHRRTDNRPSSSLLSMTIREFVNHRADPNVTSMIGTTSLHFAAEAGNVDLIRFLVKDHYANIDQLSRDNLTPFLYAAASGHAEAVIELLSLGARLPDERAIKFATAKAAELLATYFSKEEKLPEEKMLHNQIRLGCQNPCMKNPVKCLIKYSSADELEAYINQIDPFGQTPLDIAFINNNPEFISPLLDRGVNPLLGKFGVFRANNSMIINYSGTGENHMTLHEKICQSAARHYLDILTKESAYMALPKDLMLNILYIAFRDNLFPKAYNKSRKKQKNNWVFGS